MTNLSGLPGAVYPLLLLLEHEQNGLHAAKVIPALVELAPAEGTFRRHLGWWLGALFLLAGVTAWRQAARRRR